MTMGRRSRLAALLFVVLLVGCSRNDVYEWMIARERAEAGLELAEVEVSGLSIAYLTNRVNDPRRTLVMIHGFGADKDNWVRLAAHLPDDYRMLIPDLVGHGDSSIGTPDGYTVEAQAQTLSEFMVAVDAGTVDMAGNSLGGGITAFFASRYPDQVRTIALFNPAGADRYPSELDQALADGNNPLVVREPGDFEELMDFVLEKRPFMPWPIKTVMEERAIARQNINDRIFSTVYTSAQDYVLADILAAIEAPALVVWGKEDRVLNPANADVFVEGITDARKVMLEGVGHVPMLEVPKRSAELWQSFIEQH